MAKMTHEHLDFTKSPTQEEPVSSPKSISPPEFFATHTPPESPSKNLAAGVHGDHLSAKLEGFVIASRNLEKTLGQEKMRTQALSLELLTEKNRLEKAIGDFTLVKINLHTTEQKSNELRKQFLELSLIHAQATEELKTYQQRWSQVLVREEKTKQVIPRLEAEVLKTLELTEQLRVLKSKYDAFEVHSLKEMNQASDRIIELEDKNEVFQDELITLREIYRKLEKDSQTKLTESQSEIVLKDMEIKDLQALSYQLRHKLETHEADTKKEMQQFEEKTRHSIERESAWEREKFREAFTKQMRTEMDIEVFRVSDKKLGPSDKIRDENLRLNKQVIALKKALKAEQSDFELKPKCEVEKRLLDKALDES